MARVIGVKSEDGKTYDLWQGNRLLKSIPISEAMESPKLAKAIRQNKWSGM